MTSSIGIATAYTINDLPSIKLGSFQQTYETSKLTAAITKTTMRKNSVTIMVQVTNNDSTAHSANVIVACYSSSDNLLQEIAQLTGTLAGGSSGTMTYTFSSVSREGFSYAEVTIEDLT